MPDEQVIQRFGKDFPQGAVLFREGEAAREMYVVQQGRVNVSKRAGDVEKILSSLGPGELVGEMALLTGQPRSATATCAEPSRLLVVDSKTFEAMVRSSAEIAVRLIRKLAERLREADEQIGNLLLADASSRVVDFLATAAEKVARGPAGHELRIPAAELPARVGVRREQADEVLAKLVKASVVSLEPDRVLVPDVAKLRHFLEFLRMKAQFGELS